LVNKDLTINNKEICFYFLVSATILSSAYIKVVYLPTIDVCVCIYKYNMNGKKILVGVKWGVLQGHAINLHNILLGTYFFIVP